MVIKYNSMWAILTSQLDSVYHMYERQLEYYSKRPEANPEKPEGADLVALESGSILDTIPASFDVKNGVGILPIEGMIIPKSDFFSLFFGGFAALDILTRDISEMIEREDIHTIVLDIDSPGGSAFGVQQFANLIFEARGKKPIIAVTSGMMASAAMWIGAAAHKVYITGDVTVVGSIGTVTSHTDISGFREKMGVKTTEITAGKFKRVPSMFEPLNDEGRAVLQGQVDHANKAFIKDIATFRGVTISVVNNKMADGRTFIGTQAIKIGLIDGKLSMDEIMESVGNVDGATKLTNQKNSNFNNLLGGNGMTLSEQLAELKNSNNDVYEALVEQGKLEAKAKYEAGLPDALSAEHAKGVEIGKAEGKEEGIKAERGRITGLRELANASNGELIEKFIADGTTQAPDAAVEILKAQKVKNGGDLKNLEKESPDPLDLDSNNDDNTDNSTKGLRQLVTEYMAEHKCTKGTAIIACTKAYPDAKNDFIAPGQK